VNDSLALLRALTSAGVDFTVVGGTAAVLHGAATATYDLDVLMRFSEANCTRLLAAIGALHPRLSHTVDKRPLTLTALELTGFRNLYLATDLGRLDLLGTLPPIKTPEEVHQRGVLMDLDEGLTVRVIALDDLIRVKDAMSRPKDKIAATELKAIRAAKSGGAID